MDIHNREKFSTERYVSALLVHEGLPRMERRRIYLIFALTSIMLASCQSIQYYEYQTYPTFSLADESKIEKTTNIIRDYLVEVGFNERSRNIYVHEQGYIYYKIKTIKLENTLYCPTRTERECAAVRLYPYVSFNKPNSPSAYKWNERIRKEILPLIQDQGEVRHFSLNYNSGGIKSPKRYKWCGHKPKRRCKI